MENPPSGGSSKLSGEGCAINYFRSNLHWGPKLIFWKFKVYTQSQVGTSSWISFVSAEEQVGDKSSRPGCVMVFSFQPPENR